ncbi:MAG: shikimate dehydrogenase [Bacteroidetes bacterium]|nr:shikimate dehydrogenase [Bacteroidota bacterium]
MPQLGIIGFPLGHSFSPSYFNNKFKQLQLTDWLYRSFPIEHLSALPDLLKNEQDLVAFNVTIPHKKNILNYCHEFDDSVIAIGAANLITINRSNDITHLKAYNTDYLGFKNTLEPYLGSPIHQALVLGTGGSSLAIQYALKQLDIPFQLAGRHTNPSFERIDLSAYDLIVNCTPVGMAPVELQGQLHLNLQYSTIKPGALFYDLIYNPSETHMMKLFSEHGARVKNGLDMLYEQAEVGWKIISSHV